MPALRFLGVTFLLGECLGRQGIQLSHSDGEETSCFFSWEGLSRRKRWRAELKDRSAAMRAKARANAEEKRHWRPEWLAAEFHAHNEQEIGIWNPLWAPLARVRPGRRRPVVCFRRHLRQSDKGGRSQRTSAKWGRRGERIGEASHPGPAVVADAVAPSRRRQRHQRSRSRAGRPATREQRSLNPNETYSCFPNPQGKWECLWCSSCVASKSYLITHTRRDHEGDELCQGPEMEAYLAGVGRWLCGRCFRTNKNTAFDCEHCEAGRDEAVDGSDPAGTAGPLLLDRAGEEDVTMGEGSEDLQAAPTLPPLRDICQAKVTLVKRIPLAARSLWAEVLTAELDRAASSNNLESWSRLLMLPKCVLWIPRGARGGHSASKGRNSLAKVLKRRLEQWQLDQLDSLWNQVPKAGQREEFDEEAAVARRALKLASEGQYRRACQALGSLGVHKMNDSVIKILDDLHPRSPKPALPSDSPPEAVVFDQHEIRNALFGFAPHTSAGATGLSPQHLKDAAGCRRPIQEERFLAGLTRLTNVLVAGECCDDVAPFLGGALLIALRKDDDGVRPVAIGESYRRLVGKALMKHDTVTSRLDSFVPLQVGVGCRGGAEAVARAVRTLVDENKDDDELALLKIDFRNAFNTFSREAMLKAVEEEFPELSRWSAWCYASPTHLWAGESTLSSSSGTQQGDPLGPLLFSLVLKSVSETIAQRHPDLKLNVWYLDDGTLVGSRQALADVLEFLNSDEVKQKGLHLNMAKCEVWWPSGDQSFPEFPPDVPRLKPDGVEVLKLPVGTDDYVASVVRKRVHKTIDLIQKLDCLQDEHVEFTILRACLGSCKLVYTLRGTYPSARVLDALQEADDALRDALERLSKASLSDLAWKQSSLSPSQGGLGLRHACDMARPAFLGSVADTAPLVARILGRSSIQIPQVREASNALMAKLGVESSSPLASKLTVLGGPLDSDALLVFTKQPQAELQKAVDEKLWQELYATAAANDRDRLDAVSRPRAGAWLSAFPCRALGLWMPQAQFVISLQLWLGTAEPQDTRALRQSGAGMYGRHHAIRDVIFEAGRAAALRPRREVAVDNSGRRPADVFLPSFSQGRPLCIDVTISHPSQTTTTLQARGGVSASEQAALDKFVQKTRRYGEQCSSSGVDFLPVPVCAFGGMLESSTDFFDCLAARLAEHTGLNRSVAGSQLWQRLSVRLWTGNAKMVLQNRAPATGHWLSVSHRL